MNWRHIRLESGQIWGSVRLVPIIRDEFRNDLRLDQSAGTAGRRRVTSSTKNAFYTSYLPQALVVRWDKDGGILYTSRTHLGDSKDLCLGQLWRRGSSTELAFLPQALAIEGFLVRHFRGPDIAWLDYQRAVRHGTLGVRSENSVPGWYVKGLREALRLFEYAPNQVGTALYVDEQLQQVFLTPHPDDYAALHESLLCDHYAEYLVHFGYLRYSSGALPLDLQKIHDFESLEAEFAATLERAAVDDRSRLEFLSDPAISWEVLYTTELFTLERFVTPPDAQTDSFAGEAIKRIDGSLEYLKLFRLTRAQNRRLHLLSTLAKVNWSFSAAAELLGLSEHREVARALIAADLGYLLNPGLYGDLLLDFQTRKSKAKK